MAWKLNYQEIVTATGAKPLGPSGIGFGETLEVHSVQTDTRKGLKDALFVALKGANHDGHEHLRAAQQAGAKAALVHRLPANLDAELVKNFPLFMVEDTLNALQDLARFHRRKCGFRVLAITGSSGKTTVKDFAQGLIQGHFRCSSSQGSMNNHWGVPISLLRADADHQIVIQEMGMNHLGEISRLCEIAEPNVAVCTMVGTAHIGELGGVDEIAQAKEEIYLASPQARFIFNMDNEFTLAMQQKYADHQPPNLTFASHRPEVDISIRAVKFDPDAMYVHGLVSGVFGEARLPVFGRHNVVNLMAACALAVAVGVPAKDIWETIPSLKTSWGRNQWLASPLGFRVLFDAYNANLESMTALLKNIYEISAPGRKMVLLGDMLELGPKTQEFHERVGRLAAQIDLDYIWFVGKQAESFQKGLEEGGYRNGLVLTTGYDQNTVEQMRGEMRNTDLLFAKASRGVGLERIVEGLLGTPLE